MPCARLALACSPDVGIISLSFLLSVQWALLRQPRPARQLTTHSSTILLSLFPGMVMLTGSRRFQEEETGAGSLRSTHLGGVASALTQSPQNKLLARISLNLSWWDHNLATTSWPSQAEEQQPHSTFSPTPCPPGNPLSLQRPLTCHFCEAFTNLPRRNSSLL